MKSRLRCVNRSELHQEERMAITEGNIPRQLGAILDVLGLEWTSLFGQDNRDAGQNRNQVVAWLYRILDTLDNKTAHLLRFAALLLAAQTFLAGILVRNRPPLRISILALPFLFSHYLRR